MKAISRVRSGSLLHRSKCIQDVCPESPGVYPRWNFPEIHCFFSIANVSGKWRCPKSSGYIIQNGAIFSGGTVKPMVTLGSPMILETSELDQQQT